MANTSSAKKAARKIVARTEVNRDRRGRLRTYVKKVEEAIAAGKEFDRKRDEEAEFDPTAEEQ